MIIQINLKNKSTVLLNINHFMISIHSLEYNTVYKIHHTFRDSFLDDYITEDEFKRLSAITREYNKVNYLPVIELLDDFERQGD